MRFDPPPVVTCSGKVADGQRPQDLVDGNTGTGCMFSELQGAVVSLRFASPVRIGSLGLAQGGWSNWAHPKRIRVTCDDSTPFEITLQCAPFDWGAGTAGAVQAIPIGHSVTAVRIEVIDVYSTGFPWGSPGELGIAAYPPARLHFGTGLPCADPRLQAVSVSMSRTPPGRVRLSLTDADGNEYRKAIDNVGSEPRDVMIPLAQFAPVAGAFPHLAPYRLRELSAAADAPDALVALSAHLMNRAGPEPGWAPLPPVERPTKVFEGKPFTEGLSATSTGRFGNSLLNGLLTETVEGLQFRVSTPRAPGAEWDAETFQLRIPGTVGAPKAECVPSFAAATLRYTYPGGAKVTERLSAMVPGFLIETAGSRIGLVGTGAGSLPRRSGQPNEPEAAWALQSGPKAAHAGECVLLYPDAGGRVSLLSRADSAVTPSEPWCVAIYGHADRGATLSGDRAVAVLMTFEGLVHLQWQAGVLNIAAKDLLGTVGISTAFGGLLGDEWKPEAVADRARQLTRLLHTFPDGCREWYRVEREAVQIVNEFSYHRWGDRAWQATDYAPVPPLYSAGPRPLVTGTYTGIDTRFGPFVTRPGSRLSYRLPLLPFEHAALPRTGNNADLVDPLRKSVEALAEQPPIKPAWHAWQTSLYDGWPSALLGATLYPPEVNEKLIARACAGVELTFHPRVWMRRAELYSGRRYVATGWCDRSAQPPMLGDPNSAAGSALYSLYLYALYSGDEATVRRLWPVARDVTRFFEVVNDWAVPQTSAREAANFSNIDMDTIAHLGLGGYWWLATRVGTRQEADHAAYLYAKVAPVAAMRFLFPRIVDPKAEEPALFCDGFTEEGPTLRILADDMVVKDCVAMCLSWCGQQPEMYRFLMDFLGPDECRHIQADVIEKHLPKWREMAWNRTRVASHLAQRAWLPDWPATDLKLDAATFTGQMGAPSPETAGLIALLQGRGLPVVIDWWPKRLLRLEWRGEREGLQADLDGPRAATLSFRWDSATLAADLNGERAALDRPFPDRAVWSLKLPSGPAHVRIAGAQ
jgi:hypothetical protein